MSPLAVQWQALEPSEFAVDLADYRNDLRFVKYETEVRRPLAKHRAICRTDSLIFAITA